MSRVSAPVRFRLLLAGVLVIADVVLLERMSGCSQLMFFLVSVVALPGMLLGRPLDDWHRRRLDKRRPDSRSDAPPTRERGLPKAAARWFLPAAVALLAVIGMLMAVLARTDECAVAYPAGGAIVVAAVVLVSLGDRELARGRGPDQSHG